MIENHIGVEGDAYLATTTVTSFRIIEALGRRDGVTVSELVDELGLASGTVYKHLNTLQEIHYVSKDGPEYRLGLGFLELGVTARSQTNLYEQTYDALSSLAETTGAVTTLMVPEHGYGIYLTQVVPEGAVMPPHRSGERVHLHATAGGKAILAYQSKDTVESWTADRGLPAVTSSTITDADTFWRELQSVRDRRTAQSREEQFEGWQSIAAPLTDDSDESFGAVSVKTPTDVDGNSVDLAEARNLLGSTVNSMTSKLRLR